MRNGGACWAFIAAALVALGLIVVGTIYWLHARNFETTDDAFVDGYVTEMAPQVAGRVLELQFADNEHITAGQTLVLIDPRDYQAKLDQVTAQRANAEASVAQAHAQLAVQRANLDQSRANVQVAEVGSGSGATGLRSLHLDRSARGDPPAGRQRHRDMRAPREPTRCRPSSRGGRQRAGRRGGRSSSVQPRPRCRPPMPTSRPPSCSFLGYCTIVAPVTGRIGHRTVGVGNYVNPSQALFAIVQDDMWVTANFKETQLADMRPGQPVDISIDAIPLHEIPRPGGTSCFQPGSGTEFSVLPAENATGNFVKIVHNGCP